MFHFDEEKHLYTLDGLELESVTGILKAEGFIDTRFYDEWSRARGEYVHTMIHLYDRGELDEEALDPQLVPYLEAYKKFLKESCFRVVDSEVPRYHPQLLYAGTPDKVGFFDVAPTKDILSVIDIKSGRPEPWAAIQTAGYVLLIISEFKVPRVNRYALELRNDATYKLIPYKDRADAGTWLSVLAVHNWKKNNLRRPQ